MPSSVILALAALLAVPALAQTAAYVHTPTAPGATSLLVWDSTRSRVVAIEAVPEPRLWDWDGSAWTVRLGAPAPGGVPTGAAYDPHRRVVLTHLNGAVREWDGAHWTLRTGIPVGPVVAFDVVRQRLIAPASTAVHEWDGTAWHVLQPQNVILPRTATAFAYDPFHQRCVLYGGAVFATIVDDCWSWNGADWTLLAQNSPPGPRSGCCLAYEPTTGRMILYGGDAAPHTTWALSGTTWTQIVTLQDPGARSGAQFVWDGQGLLLRGGSATRGGELWRFSNNTWVELPGGTPMPRRPAAFAWDPLRSEAVLFGGSVTTTSTTTFSDTWTFDGQWHPHRPPTAPVPRSIAWTAWSSSDNALLLFGGSQFLSDTWNWTGTSWVQRTPATSPPPRNEAALVQDPAGGVLLFGGSIGTTLFGDQWHWDGNNWLQQTAGTLPGPRTRALAAFDPFRNVAVLAGGRNLYPLQETWEWNGTGWTQRAATPFTDTATMRIGFRPDTGRVRVESSGQWEWDGTAWTGLPPPVHDEAARLASDPLRNRVLRFPLQGQGLAVLSPAPGMAARYGNGCAIGPAPALTTIGRPIPGATGFGVVVTTYAPGAPLLLAFGLQPTNVPLGSGCSGLVDAVLGVQFRVASPLGEATQPLAIPSDLALRGVSFVAQTAVVDATRGLFAGLTISDGLRLVIGD